MLATSNIIIGHLHSVYASSVDLREPVVESLSVRMNHAARSNKSQHNAPTTLCHEGACSVAIIVNLWVGSSSRCCIGATTTAHHSGSFTMSRIYFAHACMSKVLPLRACTGCVTPEACQYCTVVRGSPSPVSNRRGILSLLRLSGSVRAENH